jgi:ribosomal protein L11 methylase PrmA
VYRQVNPSYAEHYHRLMEGLYPTLVEGGQLIAHREVELAEHEAFRIIKPVQIPMISYPWEWSFSQLREAALLTLDIQKQAVNAGMSLKDASAFNVQFLEGRPVFIDTLSFEVPPPDHPWVAYQQFCRHFLAPLALMAHTDIGLGQLFRIHLDGVPLPLASRLLPCMTRLNFGLVMHLHLHARSSQKHSDDAGSTAKASMSKTAMLGLIDNLQSTIRKLSWTPAGTEWGDYYSDTNYSEAALGAKASLVRSCVEKSGARSVWDLGANTGVFSRVAAEAGCQVVSFDIDPAAVEKHWLSCRERGETRILPLLQDLTNPSGGLGWDHRERDSLAARGPVDLALALALIHHLAISNNVPLDQVASFLRRLCRKLIIEFVPKSDSQVARLLASREDIFPDYHHDGFEAAFAPCFTTLEKVDIPGTERRLYLMEAK